MVVGCESIFDDYNGVYSVSICLGSLLEKSDR